MRNRDFRISESSRRKTGFTAPVFETASLGSMYGQAQQLALAYNASYDDKVSAGNLNAVGLLHYLYQSIVSSFLSGTEADPFSRIKVLATKNEATSSVLEHYRKNFPTAMSGDALLNLLGDDETARAFFVHRVFQENPAARKACKELLKNDTPFPEGTKALAAMMGSYLRGSMSIFESPEDDLFSFLTHPSRLFPDSLKDQIEYILENWSAFIRDDMRKLLLTGIGSIKEEEKPRFEGKPSEAAPSVPDYSEETDVESFSSDTGWMPNVVMLAKNALVWLDQLSAKHRREIDTLDKIPDEELDELRDRGFTALWLIGLWERSPASRKIKRLCGNPEAESSAYSLRDYEIAQRLGGWKSLENLKWRCLERGIRLASDMVPNHTGLDSTLLEQHPDYFIGQSWPPFPSYTFNGPDLSSNPDFDIRIEDHYYDRTDAAVTFRRIDRRTGETTYIFHGNDGTSMPWNDTAQIDFLNPQAREAVIRQIVDVARTFPIIRFDAAMTLAKKHIQRLWYPSPGNGGDIAGRSGCGLSDEEFNRLIPQEFWREVVDRIAVEAPDTLLLAEAFWMMESYFVRTLGMHRVYNSAFMHMMKNEDNARYRESIKSTLAFDPEILKRWVNFMNNPDEETAVAQFGDGDKYFGVCTMLATMPGLPMFGHGQFEGYREKYGMEYQKAYMDEKPNADLVRRHNERIVPLLKQRHLFSESANFELFDVKNGSWVEESIYAFTNGVQGKMTLVLYNNRFDHTDGWIKVSCQKLVRTGMGKTLRSVSLGDALKLSRGVRRFMIYRDFGTGLTHLMPCFRVHEDGWQVSLDGYQTKVYTDIREIEDIDGIYDRLYRKIGDNGFQDLEREMRALYLEPFFNAAESLTTQKFLKDMKSILMGRTSPQARMGVLQSMGTYYTYLDELHDLMAKMGLKCRTIRPQTAVELVSRIESVCMQPLFRNGNTICSDTIVKVAAAGLMLIPFVTSDTPLDAAVDTAGKLMLESVLGIPESTACRGALLASECVSTIEQLLDGKAFRYLIGCNVYNGITWYRGEDFQDCLYLTCLSQALFSEEPQEEGQYERYMAKWLSKSAEAGYRIEGLK